MGPGWLSLVGPKLQCFCQCQGILGLSEPVVQAHKVPLGLGKEGIPLFTVRCWWWGVGITFTMKIFCLGKLKWGHICLAKLIGSLGVGTIANSGHQAGVSTWNACHITTPWSHPGVAWVSLTAQTNLHHQAALPQTGSYLGVGPGWVGSQGLPHSLGPFHGVIRVTG